MTSIIASTGATITDDFKTVQKKNKRKTSWRNCAAPLCPKPPVTALEGKTYTGILSGGVFSFHDGAA